MAKWKSAGGGLALALCLYLRDHACKSSDAENDVSVSIYHGMFHVFQLTFDLIPEAGKAWKEIGDFLQGQFGCTHRFRR